MTTTARTIPPAADMRGRLVTPADADWDAAREAFNTTLDIRPAAVAFPRDARDVAAAVRHARRHGLRVARQATAHNPGQYGGLGDALVVDVRRIRGVRIDPEALRVRVGAGVKWRDVTPRLPDLGLAALHGSSPDVGVAGYSLGGGIGWLARTHGMQTNSVTAIGIVTADGRLRRVDAGRDPDLFWALRGGDGNFGVVTAIEFAVDPLEGLYAREGGDAAVAAGGDDDVAPASRTSRGSIASSDRPTGGSIADVSMTGPRSRTGASRARRPRLDPLPFALGHSLIDGLPPEAVDALLAVAGPGSGSGTALTALQLRHMGGALARAAEHAGACATLPGEVCMVCLGVVPDEAAGAVVEGIIHRVEAALAPLRAGDYPNFVEVPADASAFFDPETWARLRRVKAAYDPDDVFRGNHRIPPAG